MKKTRELIQSDLDSFLALLSPDRDVAAERYLTLRDGLIRFFTVKGCDDPLPLADETLDRVARRADSFDGAKGSKITSFVYGFASRIFLEYARSAPRRETPIDPEVVGQLVSVDSTKWADEKLLECLSRCLAKLTDEQRSLLIEYYSRDRQAKIDLRKEMAERMASSMQVLHTKIFRLRTNVRKCINECIDQNDQLM
jgi:DNA-directed RNA polymerase specialized sigma24 family protein